MTAVTPTRPEPVYVIAGTLTQAKATALDLGMGASPWTREWAWVRDANSLRGLRGVRVAVGHGATQRSDWTQLRWELAVIEPVLLVGSEHVFGPG